MHISSAPPAATGVSHIMGIGADGLPAMGSVVEPAASIAGWLGLGYWLGAIRSGQTAKARVGLGVAAAGFAARLFLR